MNYYERHIGDYLKDTAHLSLLEHGVYCRLLDVYYTREGSIPDDQVERLVGARTREDRAAVRAVLAEFFEQRGDGWHQDRCDREIERFTAGEPDREVKKANTDNRLARHRDERRALFQRLTTAGQHADWNIGIMALRALVGALPATGSETDAQPLPATAPATPATATQTPVPDTSPRVKEISLLPQAPARPSADPPQLALVEAPPKRPPDCPHLEVLALWAEVLPALPQHDPKRWRGAKADHLRARWRETAVAKRWPDAAEGLTYFRRLFAFVGRSPFLVGRAPVANGKRPFVIELEWLVNLANWDKVHEGKYHEEATA